MEATLLDRLCRAINAHDLEGIARDGTQWGEWEQRGTAMDGSPHLVRGVVIFTVASELVQSARFYLEPVDEGQPA
jgi:hypothetical protein